MFEFEINLRGERYFRERATIISYHVTAISQQTPSRKNKNIPLPIQRLQRVPSPRCWSSEFCGYLNIALIIAVSPPTCTTSDLFCAEIVVLVITPTATL